MTIFLWFFLNSEMKTYLDNLLDGHLIIVFLLSFFIAFESLQ